MLQEQSFMGPAAVTQIIVPCVALFIFLFSTEHMSKYQQLRSPRLLSGTEVEGLTPVVYDLNSEGVTCL